MLTIIHGVRTTVLPEARPTEQPLRGYRRPASPGDAPQSDDMACVVVRVEDEEAGDA